MRNRTAVLIKINNYSGSWHVECVHTQPSSSSSSSSIVGDNFHPLITPLNNSLAHQSDVRDDSINSDSVTINPSEECRISLKLAMEILPKFDGKTMPVWEFTKNCRDIYHAVKLNERKFLLKIIERKIVDDARRYVRRRRDAYDLEELLSTLERAFKSRITLDALQAQMSNIYHCTSESAIQYGNRVNELLDDIIDAIDKECKPDVAHGVKCRAIDNALNCFITGLNNKIEAQVRQKAPRTLQIAIDIAMTEEEHQRLRSRIIRESDRGVSSIRDNRSEKEYSHHKIHSARVFNIRDSRRENFDKISNTCHICKESGHFQRDCPHANKHRNNHPPRKEVQRCNYCQRIGHFENDCYTKRDRERKWDSRRINATNEQSNNHLNSNRAPRIDASRNIAIVARPESTELITIPTNNVQNSQ